jgi:hypothetical protein
VREIGIQHNALISLWLRVQGCGVPPHRIIKVFCITISRSSGRGHCTSGGGTVQMHDFFVDRELLIRRGDRHLPYCADMSMLKQYRFFCVTMD